jgi:hypothetical protein
MMKFHRAACNIHDFDLVAGQLSPSPLAVDLLVRPHWKYSATSIWDGSTATPQITFDIQPNQPFGPPFTAFVGSSFFACACDAKGSFSKPLFFAAKTFTCVQNNGNSVIRGKVAGKDGTKILKLQTLESPGQNQSLGTCTLNP